MLIFIMAGSFAYSLSDSIAPLSYPNPPPNLVIRPEISGLWSIPDPPKVLNTRRRGAPTEAYGAIRRKEERSKATPPIDFAQDRESFDFAQDREPVERPVERQMMP